MDQKVRAICPKERRRRIFVREDSLYRCVDCGIRVGKYYIDRECVQRLFEEEDSWAVGIDKPIEWDF